MPRKVSDEVLLQVPSTPELLRLARVAASGIASRLGFSYDEVEDVRLAVDELCFALVGKGRVGSTLEVRFDVNGDTMTIEGRAHPGDEPEVTELTERILAHLVDEWEMLPREGDGGPGFRMRKQRQNSAQ